jgi:hypothetical protein
MVQKQASPLKRPTESALRVNKPERKSAQLPQVERAQDMVTPPQPLGLCYSFVVQGTDGWSREVDSITAVSNGARAQLTVETNQEGYLQIWQMSGASAPQLLLPNQVKGEISIKVSAGQRLAIPLPITAGPITLTARLSRVLLDILSKQGTAGSYQPSTSQRQESITRDQRADLQEQATYIVKQDPTSAQLSITISLTKP